MTKMYVMYDDNSFNFFPIFVGDIKQVMTQYAKRVPYLTISKLEETEADLQRWGNLILPDLTINELPYKINEKVYYPPIGDVEVTNYVIDNIALNMVVNHNGYTHVLKEFQWRYNLEKSTGKCRHKNTKEVWLIVSKVKICKDCGEDLGIII
jgi:hypothetical protein